MNLKELEEKVFETIDENGSVPALATQKVMLLFNQFNTPAEKKKLSPDGIHKVAESLVEMSPKIRQLIERKKWTPAALKEQAVIFVDMNYPYGGMELRIRQHFLNWMKYQDPPTNKPKTIIDAN